MSADTDAHTRAHTQTWGDVASQNMCVLPRGGHSHLLSAGLTPRAVPNMLFHSLLPRELQTVLSSPDLPSHTAVNVRDRAGSRATLEQVSRLT